MQEVKDARGLHILVIEETGTRHRGARKPSGRIDIMVLDGFVEHVYLGIECKRVHSRRASLAKKYVDQGLMRFVTGRYSAGLPYGVLLGFVIDGKCDACAELIREAVIAGEAVNLTRGWQPAGEFALIPNLFSTAHKQATSGPILMLHLFLSYQPPTRKTSCN